MDNAIGYVLIVDYFERTWLNGQIVPGPTTIWRDGTTKSRRSLGRVISTSLSRLKAIDGWGSIIECSLKQRNKERRLKKIQEKFDNGDYTLANYLSALSFWVGF